MPEVLSTGLRERTLAGLVKQLVLTKEVQGEAQVLFVFLQVKTENQDVIQVKDDELTDLTAEACVHQALKRGWRVAQTEWHDAKMVMAVMSLESCFFFVFSLIRIW